MEAHEKKLHFLRDGVVDGKIVFKEGGVYEIDNSNGSAHFWMNQGIAEEVHEESQGFLANLFSKSADKPEFKLERGAPVFEKKDEEASVTIHGEVALDGVERKSGAEEKVLKMGVASSVEMPVSEVPVSTAKLEKDGGVKVEESKKKEENAKEAKKEKKVEPKVEAPKAEIKFEAPKPEDKNDVQGL